MEKTFEAIHKLKEIEIELHRLKNALEMANKALDKTQSVGCAECGASGGHALYCVACAEKYVIKGAVLVEEMQREQDCVGWFGYDEALRLWFETNKNDDCAIPLYKDQQRTWVGLTDEDIQKLAAEQHDWESLYLAVQAKLKEKNT